MRFQGKVCLVSGAGSGIGKAAAKQFAGEGGKVVVIDLKQFSYRASLPNIFMRRSRLV
jgi:NAD(P)-dependent dehydrogenase (short-subunit alcohol dehydrogenase family)